MSYNTQLCSNSLLTTNDVYRPSSYTIEFRVCELGSQYKYNYIEVPKNATIQTLKETIAKHLRISVSTSKFYLEVYDETLKKWKKINDERTYYIIQELNLEAGSLLSVGYYSHEIWKNGRLSSISAENDKQELTLQLCTQPMNENNFSYLNISINSTLRKLRNDAYEKLNKSAVDRPIYRLNGDCWEKFSSDMDSYSLATLGFQSYAVISLDCDENDSISKSPAGLCGLANLGSTCFMNSVFQCLSNVPEFTKKILELDGSVNAPIIGGYIQLIRRIWSRKFTTIEPNELVTSISECLPTYTTYRQQDAQEFMNHFLDLMHGELSNKETLITELFYGRIQSTVKCLTCQHTEITNEPISFLPLPISDYNLRTVLYLKVDGEQCLVSIVIDSSIYFIKDLIDSFIKQYNTKLTRDRIHPIQFQNHEKSKSLDTWAYLTDVPDNELVFLERPQIEYDNMHIQCDFIDHSTGKPFRPPTFLTGPKYTCRYSHLWEQIDQLVAHLCSITQASYSQCDVYWEDLYKKEFKWNITDNTDRDLPNLRRIIIKFDSVWANIYKEHYNSNYSSKNSGLYRLLDHFFDETQLDDDYKCLKCSKPTKARQKSSLISPLPRVLLIQLKRFAYNEKYREKIDTLISFPLQGLNLKNYLLNDENKKSTESISTTYDLVAVSNHSGSMSFGHYTTYAKNNQDNNWYVFDDRYIRKLSDPSDIVTKNAYILVYIRNNS